jgi:hypothetical protein
MAEYGEVDEPFDYQVPIMSLPVVFKTDLDTIPPVPCTGIPRARFAADASQEASRCGWRCL